jgi:biotin carboxyl carrier protein
MRKETLLAPLTGIVAQIYTPNGASVQVNDEILSIECMKLYYPVISSLVGRLNLIINIGEYVQEGQELGSILEE